MPVSEADPATSLPPGHQSAVLARLARFAPALLPRILVLIGVFMVIDLLLFFGTRLSVEDYSAPIIFLRPLLHPLFWPTLALTGIMAAVLGTRLWTGWQFFQHYRAIRAFVMVNVALLMWPFAFLPYNHLVDQAHLLDRGLLLILGALIWHRPVFVLPFIALCYAIMFQLLAPGLGGPVIAHKLTMYQMLAAFGAYFLVRLANAHFRPEDWLFLTLCIMAGRYWEPGLAKLMLGWFEAGNIARNFVSAWVHGWLSPLSATEIVALAQRFEPYSKLLGAIVITIELAAVLLFAHRRYAIVLLTLFIGFHAGVFFLMGYVFWSWAGIDLALIVLLIWQRRNPDMSVFTRRHLALSVPLIILAPLWSRPPHLGWYDTGLTYHTRVTAIGASGNRYPVPPQTFGPYVAAFTMNGFGYLVSDYNILTASYGITTSADIAQGIFAARTDADIFALEEQWPGRSIPDADRAENFYAFLQRYFTHLNANGPRLQTWAALGAPRQFWSLPSDDAYAGQEPVTALEVHAVTYFYDGTELRQIRDVLLRQIEIPTADRAETE